MPARIIEMMAASGTSAAIAAHSVPLLPGVVEMAASGVVPGGTRNNLDYTAPHVDFGEDVPDIARILLNDAQTSGWLLISLPADRADGLIELLRDRGISHAVAIGTVEAAGGAGQAARIVVRD